MNKLLLIIQREYMSLVARKSFIVITILVPFLFIIIASIPVLTSKLNSASSSLETVTVIDETGRLSGVISDNEQFRFIPLRGEPGTTNVKRFFDQSGESMSALVVIPANVLDSAKVNIYSKSTVNMALVDHVTDCLNDTLTSVKLATMGVPDLDKIVREAQVDIDVNSVKLADDGSESESSTTAAMLLGMVLSLITYMFVLTYGAMIMNSVIEEKTNRIVEVIVSSCKPFQLMMGKIIGVALVGLTQFLIWAVIISGLAVGLGIGLADSGPMSEISNLVGMVQSVNLVGTLVCFVIYFLGGYLLYAALFAGFGSAVDQASDASQFTAPIIIVMIVALYAGRLHGKPQRHLRTVVLHDTVHITYRDDGAPALRRAVLANSRQCSRTLRHRHRHHLAQRPHLPHRHPPLRQKIHPKRNPNLDKNPIKEIRG